MTGDPRRWASEPGLPGIVKFWGPYTYRSAFHSADDAEESQRALAQLADVLVVELAQQGEWDRAVQVLHGGYRYGSSQVVLLLKELKRNLLLQQQQ